MIRQSVFLLMLSVFLVACADYNSSTLDDLEYVEVTANDNDPNFPRAFGIIKKHCADCHQDWYSYNTNAKWINESGRIVKQEAANSELIKRIRQNGTTGNMPLGSDLPEDDYNFLKKWINEMP